MWQNSLILGTVVVIASFLAWIAHHAAIRVPRQRRLWSTNRGLITDEDWAGHFTTGDASYAICLELRKILARSGHVPPETISPDDLFTDLETQLTIDGFDSVKVVMDLEDWLAASIPDALAAQLPAPGLEFRTVGDWVRAFLPQWERVAKELGP